MVLLNLTPAIVKCNLSGCTGLTTTAGFPARSFSHCPSFNPSNAATFSSGECYRHSPYLFISDMARLPGGSHL